MNAHNIYTGVAVSDTFMVTELTSSVSASNRNFACENEEIVYRCKAQRINSSELFTTRWMWNKDLVGQFDSDQIIGLNNTCKVYNLKLPFLHSTLVSTEDDACVSLLIFIPSLMNSSNIVEQVEITCITFGVDMPSQPLQHKDKINHSLSSEFACIYTCMSAFNLMIIHYFFYYRHYYR